MAVQHAAELTGQIRRGETPVSSFVDSLPDADWRRVPGYWFDSRWLYFRKAGGTGRAIGVTLAYLAGAMIRQLRRVFQPSGSGGGPERFLRDLTRRYDGDLELALVAYNRGPGRVEEILLNGGDPSNGYAEKVLTGTKHAVVGAGN